MSKILTGIRGDVIKNWIDKITRRLLRLSLCGMSRPKHSVSEILQVQVLFLFILSGLALTVCFAFLYIYLEMYLTFFVLLICFGIGLFSLWLLRTYHRSDLASHLALMALIIIIVVANIEFGGFDNPNDAWFMVVVVVSGLLLIKGSFWFYAVASLLIIVIFYLLKLKGVDFPLRLTPEKIAFLQLCNRIGTVLTTVFLVLLFRFERNQRAKHAKKNEQKLYELANFDSLTELSNRAYFARVFERRIKTKKARKQSLLFIDLDGFKVVNDSYGHNIGDKLLEAVAKRFKTQLDNKDLISRHGGDEFLVMPKSGYNQADIDNLCINLIRVLNQPFHIGEHILHIGCSIGVAFYPEHGNSYLELLRASDIAMYRAKFQGSEQFQVYNQSLAQETQDRNQLAMDLRNAVDRGELSLVYQPKVNAVTGVVEGHEALMRWSRQDGSIVMPSTFIAVAEEFSIVHKLGEWLINSVSKQIKEWERAGHTIKKIAINISPKQLLRSDFVTEIVRITNLYQLDPGVFELELTESVFIDSSGETLRKLKKLSDLGFSLVIDDYGTGYASLGYLKRFPVSCLKIDKSFIDEILISEQDQTIVGSTIELAHQLGLEVTAEGVEQEEQLAVLRRLGCDYIQGFYFSKPLPPEKAFEVEKF